MLESELIKTKPRTPKLQSGNDEICCLGVRGFVLISLSRLQSLNLTHARSQAFRGVFAFLKQTYLSTRSFTDARIRTKVVPHRREKAVVSCSRHRTDPSGRDAELLRRVAAA